MAGRAADAFVDMNAVIEIDVISKAMHFDPLDRLIGAVTVANGLQVADIGEKDGVAVHAGFCRRNTCICGGFDAGMTVPTVDAVIADVVLMAELYRLIARYALVGNVRGARNHQNNEQRQVRKNNQCEHREPRNQINTAVKNLGHVQFCA